MFSFIKNELRKYPELDTIRFIAVTLVVSHHLFYDSNLFFSWNKEYGWVGVDIFFTLSGFLITSILLNEYQETKTINLTSFIYKRMIRLWPSWLIALSLSFGIVYSFGLRNNELAQDLFTKFWHYLFHFGNYSHAWIGKIHTVFSHYWSLAVEEHFYLIWPCLLAFTASSKKKLMGVFTIMLVLPYLFRVYHAQQGEIEAVVTFSTHTRIDSIVWGCLLAYIYPTLKKLTFRSEFIISLVMLLLFYCSLTFLTKNHEISAWLSESGRSFISIASVLLIIIAMKGNIYGLRYLLRIPILSWLGIMSYGVYLFHFHTNTLFFGLLSKSTFKLSELESSLFVYTLPYIPAFLTYYLIDKKLHKFKKNKLLKQ